MGQFGVEGLDEPAGSLDEDAMAHGHDRGHSLFQQIRCNRFRSILCLSALTRFEEHERNAIILQQGAEFTGKHCDMSALPKFVDVIWVLKTQPTEADLTVINTVAIEVHNVIGLVSVVCPFEFGTESRKRRWAEHMDAD